jgi:hypothetical protein
VGPFLPKRKDEASEQPHVAVVSFGFLFPLVGRRGPLGGKRGSLHSVAYLPTSVGPFLPKRKDEANEQLHVAVVSFGCLFPLVGRRGPLGGKRGSLHSVAYLPTSVGSFLPKRKDGRRILTHFRDIKIRTMQSVNR